MKSENMKEQNKKFKYTKRKSSFLRTSYFRLQKGFTLIEVIAAIFVITVGIVGVSALVTQTISLASISKDKLIASYLAQEGIEISKNIRDTNFLKIHKGIEGINWDIGLTGCATGCEADYDDSGLVVSADRFLKIDGGYYKYSSSGTETPFKRKITITPDTDILKVLVEVSWRERGREHKVTVQENIYKWIQ